MTESARLASVDRAGEDSLVAPITRRRLLAWGATAAAATTVAPLLMAPGAVGRESWLRRGSYENHVGEYFRAGLGDGRTVSLRLEAVRDLIGTTPKGRSLAGHDDAFLLELRGPDTPRLPQGVSELRHSALGRRHLFVVPDGPARDGSAYAVVVNRADR
jgi:hypothetical protein